eukprot:s968_g24.t2
MTDSSSARQLAAKQGVGKVRHLDGKILWIQQRVLCGDVQLQQLPTIWNIADLCTKALTQQRVKLLLHELNLCDDGGLQVIGQEEYDAQTERHGSKRQVMQLAKNLMRVFTLMGLGPTGADGFLMQPQCIGSEEINEKVERASLMLYVCIFLLSFSLLIFAYGAWKLYKWIKGAERDQYFYSLQLAELDTAFGELRDNQSDHDRRLVHCEYGVGETARDLEFMQDYTSSVHYGLIEMGGFRRYGELTPDQNRYMYQLERANLVSHNVMGGDRYLRLVSQRAVGVHAHADTTDVRPVTSAARGSGENEESEMEVDEEVEIEDVNTREHLVNRLRELLNTALAREEFQDGAAIQHLILMALDAGQPQAPLEPEVFYQLMERVDKCTRGLVLEPNQLFKVSESIEALLRLRNGLEAANARGVEIPSLLTYCQDIDLPDRLLDIMLEAFQEDGELSLKKFPELAQLRQAVRELEEACSRTMAEVLSSGNVFACFLRRSFKSVFCELQFVRLGLHISLPFLCCILKGCQGEGDSYSCQATGFTCDGLDEFCAEKERQCDEMTWKCLGGKLECHSEDQEPFTNSFPDICDQLEIDCSKEKDSSLNKAKMKPSSFIQEAVETSARTAIHRHRKKQMSSRRTSWLSEAHLYSAYLSDDGYMQFGGHYVLGVKPRFKEKVGRMFDESRSGRTAYVEPFEVIEYADGLSKSKKELERMVRRIYGNMSLAISSASEDMKRCLKAAALIDLARARLFLGEDMEGEVPKVGDDGIIQVRQARNPCLVLRGGKKVVGYRLELGTSSQCLLLTGPNAGGKTVVLKTLGLLALLARCGIPIPGGEAPRVDFFEVVLADVGDMQTIVDDLSTYSAHLVASRIMLSAAEGVGPRALVMVDEAATGTDPQQGAALARAMLESFLEMGARVVTTTHSNQLKDWAFQEVLLWKGSMFTNVMDVSEVQLQEIQETKKGWPRLLTEDEVKKILEVPGNDVCADCVGQQPSWASVTFGAVLCSHAAGAVDIERMLKTGNNAVNAELEVNLPEGYTKPKETSDNYAEFVLALDKFVSSLLWFWGVR